MTPANALPRQTQTIEGVTVVGEAIRRASPETVEFLVEVTASAANASQAIRDQNNRIAQLTQATTSLGVQRSDIQAISANVFNVYAPVMQALPGYAGGPQQLGAALGMPPGGLPMQPDVQFGSYQAKTLLRATVREPNRVGEILDAVTRAGGTLIGSFSFSVSDEAGARRAALEAAGRDARAKAEALAQAAGKQVGDAVSISEDIIACNGAYAALRSAAPFLIGAASPPIAGELEYYARVTASFRLQ